MKKKIGIRILTALALACLLAFAASAAGETVLSDAASLSALMRDPTAWGGSYKLGADIDMRGTAQNPIGTYETPFTGSFDGAGHTVTVDITADGTAGLFGVAEGATIRGITVEGTVRNSFAATDAETKIDDKYPGTGALCGVALSGTTLADCTVRAAVTGPGNVGGLCGVVYNYGDATVTVENCVGETEITSTYGNAGGLIGRIQTASAASPAVLVSGCANRADVQSVSEDRNRLAGIAGYVRTEAGEIRIAACENTGNITAQNSGAKGSNNPFAAGIAGRIEAVTDATAAVRILDCKNTGNIESSHHAGGITAYINRSDKATETASEIVGCLNTGAVSGPSHAGGIVGYSQNRCGANVRSAVKDCENRGAVSSSACAGGLVGRWYGFDILTSYSSGKVTADSLAGGIAGKAEGEIFCETNAVYLAGTADVAVGASNPICVEMAAASVAAADAGKADGFVGFDFASVWQTGKDGATLAAFAGGKMPAATAEAPVTTELAASGEPAATSEAAASAAATEVSEDTAAATEPEETTASAEASSTAETTEAAETTAATAETAPASAAETTVAAGTAGKAGGAPVWLIALSVAAVLVILGACVLLVKKKKK